MTAIRNDVPVIMASNRLDAWHQPQLEDLTRQCSLTLSKYRWCSLDITVNSRGRPSSVMHRVASKPAFRDTPCRCEPTAEHVNDLAERSCTAQSRSDAEELFVQKMLTRATLLPAGRPAAAARSKSQTDGSVHMKQHVEQQNRAEDAYQVTVPEFVDPVHVETAHETRTALLDHDVHSKKCPCCDLSMPVELFFCQQCDTQLPDVATMSSSSFPTEERLAAAERKRLGHKPKKRKQEVEDHHDDCGDDVSILEKTLKKESFYEGYSSDDSETEPPSGLPSMLSCWHVRGSACNDPPEYTPNMFLACDVEEMLDILATKAPLNWPWGVELVEICGGQGLTSHILVKRRLRSGHNFELLTGTDLRQRRNQLKVLEYLKLSKPLVVLMAPICRPFSPLGRLNRVLNQDAWFESLHDAAPIAEFCGEVAMYQMRQQRHFAVEQPKGSTLFDMTPWPEVLEDPRVVSIVFDQCQVGLKTPYGPAKKPTELIASSEELLKPFVGKVCQGTHVHVPLTGQAASRAQVWPYEMCSRLAHGIERLVVSELKTIREDSIEPAFPAVAAGTDEGPPAEAEEDPDLKWRKCKGCLWRLQKQDPRHTRVPGECKHPHVKSVVYECEGCKAGRPRSHDSHTFDEKCRHSLTSSRTGVRKRPYARVPAEEEPTGGLKASDLGRADETRAEEMPDFEPPAPPREPESPIADPAASGSAPAGEIVPHEEGQDLQVARRGRGPDVEQRVRRTFKEGEAQTPNASDWSTFDVSTSLRGLKFADEAGQRRILRKLHIRWWHSSAGRMKSMLQRVGIPPEVLSLVDGIVDTCRICRQWTRPIADSVTSNRIVTGFNIEVEGGLIFYKRGRNQHIILHLVDRGTRWASACEIKDKSTAAILQGLDLWLSTFGPPQVLIFDGEKGLDDEESNMYFEIKGITKRTAAPAQHTRIVDRRTQVLRDCMHKIFSQLGEEGIAAPLSRVLSEAVYATNALTTVNGHSPFTAVLGRVPPLLPDAVIVADDTEGAPSSAHTHRLREIALQSIIEGTAQDRIKRALKTPTRMAGEELALDVGDPVEYYRPPEHKDASGWRGPATVIDLTRIEHGRIGVRTRADQIISCRVQDVRRCLAYLAHEMAELRSPNDSAQDLINDAVQRMKEGTVCNMMHVRKDDGTMTESPGLKSHKELYAAAMHVATTVFQLPDVTAVRCGRGIRNLAHYQGCTGSLVVYWLDAGTKALQFSTHESARISFVDLVGHRWKDCHFVQYIQTVSQEDWHLRSHESLNATQANQIASDVEVEIRSQTGHTPSARSRLSTIPEGSHEDAESSYITISQESLDEMFGITSACKTEEELEEAFVALQMHQDENTNPPMVQQLQSNAISLREAASLVEAELPSWTQVSANSEPVYMTTERLTDSIKFADHNAALDPDSDEVGPYVALEAYGHMAKVVDGLPREPQQGEHAEIRFYQAHTRKAVIDRNDDLLTDQEIRENAELVTQAILDELKTWQSFGCFERQPRAEATNLIDSKWVLKWKFKGDQRIIRARLCLRGFKEHQADDQNNSSPTATRLSQRLMVSEAALRPHWTLASCDVPKAFLQGVTYDELSQLTGRPLRNVSFEMIGEAVVCLRTLNGFQGFNPQLEVLKCLKPGTGCKDAPRAFNEKLRQVTTKYGFRSSYADSELEYLLGPDGQIRMLITKHVDDLKLCGAKEDIKDFVQHLSKTFGPISIDFNKFIFCGVLHEQDTRTGEISLSQQKFISAIRPMPIPSTTAEDGLLHEEERRHFLSLLMTIAYGLLTRPDLAVYLTALQRESHKAKLVHVRRLNLLVKWAQQNPRSLVYKPLDTYPTALVVFSDSGFQAKSTTDGLSVRGMLSIRMTKEDVTKLLSECAQPTEIKCHILEFTSKAQRHVTRSTFASEMFAATDSIDSGMLTRLSLHELHMGHLRDLEARKIMLGEMQSPIDLYCVIDALSVGKAAVAPVLKTPAECSLVVHLRWLRQLISLKSLSLIWCDTRDMLADGLTKGSVERSSLERAMKGSVLTQRPMAVQEIS